MPGLYTTGFRESGVDIGDITKNLVEKSYLLDVYPGLIPTFAAPGLFTWGFNISGQLGDGTTTQRSSPAQTIASGNNWKQVSAGVYVAGGIKTDGTLWMWGQNDIGQLGDGTLVNKSSPVQTTTGGTNWKQLSAGWNHTAAIKTDGTLWLWGFNLYGQLGEGSNNSSLTNRSSPVQTITGGTNWKQVSVGSDHTAAVKTDGTLWTWGRNAYGELGEGSNNPTLTNRSSPVQTIAGGTNWKQVECSYRRVAAIKTDGTLWGWGRNTSGELGEGSNNVALAPRSSPVQTIAGGTNWKTLGKLNPYSFHTAAIKTDGTLWLWGNNSNVELGDGTATQKSSPVQTVTGGTNWKQVSCGGLHTAAIKTDGTLWVWGRNSNGQLGEGSNNPALDYRSSPVQTITGGTNWKQVSAGYYATLAIKEFGDW